MTSGKYCSKLCRQKQSRLYQKEYFKKHPDWYLYWGVSGRSKNKGIPFNLDFEDIQIPTHCPILGIPLFRNIGGNKPTGNSPSLDRIDPTKGYTKGNVQIGYKKHIHFRRRYF